MIRRKLGVEDVDYYLRHRLLNWFGCMARMDQNQLPQQFLWSKPKCPGQKRVTTTSSHQKSIKGETTRPVPAAVGGRWCAEGATAMVKRPKGPEAGMTATSGQSQTEEGSMTHRWSAELCRRSTRCYMTGETMLKGTLRFTQHAPPRVAKSGRLLSLRSRKNGEFKIFQKRQSVSEATKYIIHSLE